MLYNKVLEKCLTVEVDRITVKSCDVHSQHQVWRWTPFSQLQNSLTLECVSAPEGAVYGDPLHMAKCDQYNASQKWNWQESSIVLFGETLRFNCYSARAGGPVELYNVVSNYSRWEDYEERNLNDETGMIITGEWLLLKRERKDSFIFKMWSMYLGLNVLAFIHVNV